jgi:tRNA A-37 threonylcarbamoyl transferase component Bud32
MGFAPTVDATLAIDGTMYRFLPHPTAPNVPHGLEGREAIVYQVSGGDGRYALKVFKPRYRVPSLVSLSERLAQLAVLPGLRASRRIVLNATKHTGLLRENPDLAYSMLMPWIDGPTWWDLLMTKRPLRKEQALSAAGDLARVLAALEERGLAHGDVSGANLLLPGLIASNGRSAVELVDLEQFYGPGLEVPEGVVGGTPGYAHRSGQDSFWGPNKDRFAGAILLTEILSWPSAKAREVAFGESFFDPDEMQGSCDRAAVLHDELESLWGSNLASCFERAWRSVTLPDCPTFAEWIVALPLVTGSVAKVTVKSRDVLAVEALVKTGDRFALRGDPNAALEVYAHAQRMTVPHSELWDLVARRIETVRNSAEMGKSAVRGSMPSSSTGSVGPSLNEPQPWASAMAQPDKNMASIAYGAVFVFAAVALAAIAVVFAPAVRSLGQSTANHWGDSIVWALGAMVVCTLLGITQAFGFRSRLAPQRRVPYVAISGVAGALAGLAAGYIWSSGIVSDEKAGAVLGALVGLIASSGHNLLIGGRGGGSKWIVWSIVSSSAIWYLATSLTWTADYSIAAALGGGLVLVLTGISHVAFLQFAPEVEF